MFFHFLYVANDQRHSDLPEAVIEWELWLELFYGKPAPGPRITVRYKGERMTSPTNANGADKVNFGYLAKGILLT